MAAGTSTRVKTQLCSSRVLPNHSNHLCSLLLCCAILIIQVRAGCCKVSVELVYVYFFTSCHLVKLNENQYDLTPLESHDTKMAVPIDPETELTDLLKIHLICSTMCHDM